MSTDNDTQKNPIVVGFNWIFTLVEGRMKFVSGVFCLVLAIITLNAAWVEILGKKRAMVKSMTATGIVEVLNSTVWILPKNTLEAKLVADRIYHEEDIVFGYTLDRRFYPESRIKSYRSKRRYDYFHLGTFWDMVQDDLYFRTEDFNIFFQTEFLKLRKDDPARNGIPFRNQLVPRDAPREQQMYMGSTFDQFWVWFDRPMHALAMEWHAASGPKTIPVRYNPDNPEDFLDEATYQKVKTKYSIFFSVFNGGLFISFGSFALFFAVFLMTEGMKKIGQVILYFVIFFAIPLFSPFVQTIIDYAGLPRLGKFILQDMSEAMSNARLEVGFLEELKFDKSEYTVFTIDVAESRYKDIYSHFALTNTPEKNTSYPLAMQDISSQITSQITTFPTKELFQFYRVLKAHMRQQRKGWDGPLLQSTKEMAVDTNRSANLRSYIISALSNMCIASKDPELAEFIYSQYISCDEDVRKYWRRGNSNFYLSSSFREDIDSSDPVRIKRAFTVWMNRHVFKENIQFLGPRLITLTQHPDLEIRKMAQTKWDSRTDWDDK